MQTYMISMMLEKIFYFYQLKCPHELSSFSWIIDQKNQNNSYYEEAFTKILPGLIEVNSVNRTKALFYNEEKLNYSFLLTSYGAGENEEEALFQTIEYTRKHYGKDLSHLQQSMKAIDYNKILTEKQDFGDSSKLVGLQIADLMISSVNRCLKKNFTNNEKMAKKLGSLLLKSPRIEEMAISMINLTNKEKQRHYENLLLEIMDLHAIKIYSKNFRKNFSNNIKTFNM